jgi:putative Mg2+ transporter-C (MgtC) family protein
MVFSPEDVIKLLMAILIGGLVGAEREYRDKSAGFRTIIFICVGATLFTTFSLKLGGTEDPVRIAASIVSGVGFLGAGAIMRGAGHVTGLTTASTIWVAAALGVGIGGGHYVLVAAATLTVLVVLWIFPKFELLIDRVHETRTYELVCPIDEEKYKQIEALFFESGLEVKRGRRSKSTDCMICKWLTFGKPRAHEALVEKLLNHTDVIEFHT